MPFNYKLINPAKGKNKVHNYKNYEYAFSIDSFVPDGYNYKEEYFLRKPSMKSGVKYGDGAIRITLLDYAEVENIKIQGCGSQGITFAQIASSITLPTVS